MILPLSLSSPPALFASLFSTRSPRHSPSPYSVSWHRERELESQSQGVHPVGRGIRRRRSDTHVPSVLLSHSLTQDHGSTPSVTRCLYSRLHGVCRDTRDQRDLRLQTGNQMAGSEEWRREERERVSEQEGRKRRGRRRRDARGRATRCG